jgi:protein CpxP
MKSSNFVSKTFVIGMAVLGLSGAALAQSSAPAEGRHANSMTQEQRQARWSEHAAKRQAKLHDALQLTAAQEPAWAAFVASMKPDGAARAAWTDRAAMRSMPAPQRMEKAIEMSKQRTAAMEQRLGSLKTFYAALTPAQQKAFDAQAMHGGHHKGGHMRRG